MRHYRLGLRAFLVLGLLAPPLAEAQQFNPNNLPVTRVARPDGTVVDPTGGTGGGGGGGTVTQGPAATDTAANRWPVLAYQGGTWSMTVSSGTVTANLGTLNGAATAAGQAAQQGSVAAGTAAAASVLGGCVYNSTTPSLTAGQQIAFQCDVNGQLKVAGAGGGGGGSTGSVTSAGTNGSVAQAVQGITGGIPQNSFPAQYNSTLPTFTNAAPGYLSADVNGRLILAPASSVSVSNFPATQAVSNGGTFAVQNTAAVVGGNTAAVKTDGSATTQPISAAALPLPSGAATAAKQPALGTAGTASTDVISVQGIAGGVAQPVSLPASATTTTGVLEPPTAASGKITVTSTAITANTNTTVAAANANRIAMGIQCGSGGVNISETGATLASATFGATGSSLTIPTGTTPYFTPPVTTRTAVTAYTATAQTCVVTEYLR